jgi:hypothetical protein
MSVQQMMLALAKKASFPKGDRKDWIKAFSDEKFLDDLITKIAEDRLTRNPEMGRIVHLVEDHIKVNLK